MTQQQLVHLTQRRTIEACAKIVREALKAKEPQRILKRIAALKPAVNPQ